jgi:F-type H+-transporting ATPase subunit b
MVLISKFFIKSLLGVMDARAKKIHGDLEGSRKAREEAEALKLEAQAEVRKIRDSAKAELAKALSEADSRRRELLDKAKADADQVVSQARQNMEAERDRIVGEIQGQVGDLAVRVAEKILGEAPSRKADERMVMEMVKNLGRARQS